MNNNNRPKIMLIATLAMFAVTAALITQNDRLVFRDEGRLVTKLDPADPDTVIFYWTNDVDVPMARRFAEGFAQWDGRVGRIVIDLHSPGGAIAEGELVLRVIDGMKKRHIVDTRVRPGHSCYSMCVPIFLAGEERRAARSSKFMFHEPSSRDYFTGEKSAQPKFEREMITRKFFNRYFVNSDMDPAWRDKLAQEWIGKDIFKSGRALVDEGSNIVTVLG